MVVSAGPGDDDMFGATVIQANIQHSECCPDGTAAQKTTAMPLAITSTQLQRFAIRKLQGLDCPWTKQKGLLADAQNRACNYRSSCDDDQPPGQRHVSKYKQSSAMHCAEQPRQMV